MKATQAGVSSYPVRLKTILDVSEEIPELAPCFQKREDDGISVTLISWSFLRQGRPELSAAGGAAWFPGGGFRQGRRQTRLLRSLRG